MSNDDQSNTLGNAVERALNLATTSTQDDAVIAFDEDPRYSTITLRVAEPQGKDIGFNIARVHQDLWNILCAEPNEVVEIRSHKRSTAALLRLTHDEGGPENVVHLDALQRRNAGVSIGDRVTVRKVSCADAEQISVAFVSSEATPIDLSPCIEDSIAGALAATQKPLTRGDIFVVPGVTHRGYQIPLFVLSTNPKGHVQANRDTVLSIRNETVSERSLASYPCR